MARSELPVVPEKYNKIDGFIHYDDDNNMIRLQVMKALNARQQYLVLFWIWIRIQVSDFSCAGVWTQK